MARNINSRVVYILQVRKLVTYKAHSAYQSRPAAEAARDALGLGAHNTKIDPVTLHA